MTNLIITIVAALVCVLLIVGWRLWPWWKGTVKPSDPPDVRFDKWNQYMVKLMRKVLEEKLLVARAVTFTGEDGFLRTIATWSLDPTVIPDVEFIALARPGSDGRPRVDAVAPAKELRALLEGHVQEHGMWGHTSWIYAWPEEIDYGAVVRRLPNIDKFRAQHGIENAGENQ